MSRASLADAGSSSISWTSWFTCSTPKPELSISSSDCGTMLHRSGTRPRRKGRPEAMRRFSITLLGMLLLPVTLSAQYFGRNRVQYGRFDFQIIQTEHFDV